ncbi:DUF2474 family protein [uncultured Sulfitobacter sp.]|nr:DUF2474 family protein [uncultured Sulfitobacter sp.]
MTYATLRKLGWFIAIWVASVAALGVVAYAIRLAIHT